MKTLGASLASHVAGYGKTLALCIKAKRTDGTLYGWTEHDQSLSINLADGDGAITYSPAEGFERTAIRTSAGLTVDETEAASFFVTAGITKDDLRAGLWDYADVWMFLVNWEDVSQGVVKLRRGKLGKVAAKDDAFTAEIRSLFELYNQEIVRLFNLACSVDLGSSLSMQGGGCGVPLPPSVWTANTAYTIRQDGDAASGSVIRPTVFNDRQYRCIAISGSPNASGASEPVWPTGIGSPPDTIVDGALTWQTEQAIYLEGISVTAVTSRRTFSISYTGTASAARITGGRVTFTSGLNAGLTFEIKRYTVSGSEVELFLPATYDINAGSPNDTLTIKLGCGKDRASCQFFDNIKNFQGFPDIPGNDQIFKTPDAPG